MLIIMNNNTTNSVNYNLYFLSSFFFNLPTLFFIYQKKDIYKCPFLRSTAISFLIKVKKVVQSIML